MKKISVALTILLAASFSTHAQTVTSASIMGYTKIATPASGNLGIISLVQFSTGSNTVHIQEAIADLSPLNASATWGSADKLIVWNGGYLKYGLYQPVAGDPYWMADGIGWNIPAAASAADVELSRGTAIWYATGSSGISTNVLVSGDVFLDDTFDVELIGSLTLLAYPYSSNVNLTNLVVSNATASATWSNADKIILWNGGYLKYGLYAPAAGDPYWMADGIGWNIPDAASAADITVNLGSGFWYQSPAGAKTIGFSKIYSAD